MKPSKSTKSATPGDSKSPALWVKTQHANLVRYIPSGRLFARFKVRGKLIKKSLNTDRISVAQLRLHDLLKSERSKAAAVQAVVLGKMTFGDASGIYFARLDADHTIKPRSKEYRRERYRALLKSWPGLAETDLAKISRNDCLRWAAKFVKNSSGSAFNNTVGTLRQILDVGVEASARYDNPAVSIKRARIKPKALHLPEPQKFNAFIRAIEDSGVCSCRQAANLVRFLAYGGFRKTEASHITWKDCDFRKEEILVRITKNGEARRVPMIPEMRTLLENLKENSPVVDPNNTVMQVKECQISMDNAAKAVGIARITHHDLRHLFATRCIESGVDIPTVSRWLGHRDGGALAMKVYGHLRDHHSVAMAQKVTFGSLETKIALPSESEPSVA